MPDRDASRVEPPMDSVKDHGPRDHGHLERTKLDLGDEQVRRGQKRSRPARPGRHRREPGFRQQEFPPPGFGIPAKIVDEELRVPRGVDGIQEGSHEHEDAAGAEHASTFTDHRLFIA